MTNPDHAYDLDRLGWLQFEQLVKEAVRVEIGDAADEWRGSANEWAWLTGNRDREWSLFGALIAAGEYLLVVCFRRPGISVKLCRQQVIAQLGSLHRDGVMSEQCTVLVITNVAFNRRDVTKITAASPCIPTIVTRSGIASAIDRSLSLRLRCPAVLGVRAGAAAADDDHSSSDGGRFDLVSARDLAEVFVATDSYRGVVDVLLRHRFAVVTGPPEMGKTAIARMIGLVMMSDGWEVHECVRPEQMWEAFDPGARQVFIADDAFGSTEYRPDIAEDWAGQLYRALHRMDDTHWLIWTSRPAPLKAGLARIHREHGMERFPKPAQIEVDAATLDVGEKALILFRHLMRARPNQRTIHIAQKRGWEIVSHEHFTPERIRRLASGRLERLVRAEERELGQVIALEVREPTRAMATSLEALSPGYRAILDAMLDQRAGGVHVRELVVTARRHAREPLPESPEALIDRLADHFLRLMPHDTVDWVHPSWRDLIIDDIASSTERRTHFLRVSGLDGLLLAISVAGGAAGERSLPFAVTDGDWDDLATSLQRLAKQSDINDAHRILSALEAAIDHSADPQTPHAVHDRRELEALTAGVISRVRDAWDEHRTVVPVAQFRSWWSLARACGVDRGPDLAPAWFEYLPSVGELSERAIAETLEWLALVDLGFEHDAQRFDEIVGPSGIEPYIDRLLDSAAHELAPDLRRPLRALTRHTNDQTKRRIRSAVPRDDMAMIEHEPVLVGDIDSLRLDRSDERLVADVLADLAIDEE